MKLFIPVFTVFFVACGTTDFEQTSNHSTPAKQRQQDALVADDKPEIASRPVAAQSTETPPQDTLARLAGKHQWSSEQVAFLKEKSKSEPVHYKLFIELAEELPEEPDPYEPPAWLAWLETGPFSFILDWTRAFGDRFYPWF